MISSKPFFESDKPLNFGHRGFAGKYPENTILSYQKAIEAGSDVLEMDVRLTRDNELVVFHDDTLDRITNSSGKVQEKSLSEIKKINVGCNFILKENGKNIFSSDGEAQRVVNAGETVHYVFPLTIDNPGQAKNIEFTFHLFKHPFGQSGPDDVSKVFKDSIDKNDDGSFYYEKLGPPLGQAPK